MHPHNILPQIHPLSLLLLLLPPLLSLPHLRNINHMRIIRQHTPARHIFDVEQHLHVGRQLRVALVVAEDGDGGDLLVAERVFVLDEQEGDEVSDGAAWGKR
jgi:hypothetical protein